MWLGTTLVEYVKKYFNLPKRMIPIVKFLMEEIEYVFLAEGKLKKYKNNISY